MSDNKLYYGDNLNVLRDTQAFPDACVDLIYLDPPFNSDRNYAVLFKSPEGQESEAQITAFDDTWHWGKQAEGEFDVHATPAKHRSSRDDEGTPRVSW